MKHEREREWEERCNRYLAAYKEFYMLTGANTAAASQMTLSVALSEIADAIKALRGPHER